MVNRHGHWACWMSTGGKCSLVKHIHTESVQGVIEVGAKDGLVTVVTP